MARIRRAGSVPGKPSHSRICFCFRSTSALAARQLWLADFILAERNLGLPAALLRRLLPGFLPWGPATPARIWLRRGGLEGCLRDAGLAAAQRRTLLAGAVRRSDLAARYGGEEFAVLLVGADLAQGLDQAERIRRAMAEKPCEAAGRSLSVTVSVGVAVVRDAQEFGEAAFDDLLARADAALYVAKAAGRNRVMAE